MNNIYVSTGAFKTKKICEILEIAESIDIKNIELSSGLDYDENTEIIVNNNAKKFNFLVHNYFPRPKKDFILNLAAQSEKDAIRSMDLAKRAIELVSEANIPVYSLHCGFAFEGTGAELGSSSQLSLKRNKIEQVESDFIKRLQQICEYAKEKNVNLAIENNVVAEYAAKDYSELYLGVHAKNLLEIVEKVNCDNLGILLDLAHLKVTARNLKLDWLEEAEKLLTKIMVVHISENNSIADENKKLTMNTCFKEFLKKLKNKPIVLEVYNLEPFEIVEQINILEELMYE